MKTRISILVASLGFARLVLSQGFVNLDFESAKIISDPSSPYYPYGIATSNAIPGWTAILGASQQSQITYNAPAIGSTWVNLWAAYGSQLSGNYSVLLQGGMTASSASISQTGLVPAFADSLLFEAQGSGPLVVSLGGQDINFFPVGSGPDYTLYGADIAAYGNQTAQLTFSALEGEYNFWNIDNIQFSLLAVPEPNTLRLSALGGIFLACCNRRIFSKAKN